MNHRAAVRTFHPRRGRLSGRHLDALDRLRPVLGFRVGTTLLDPVALFGRAAPLVVEIGSGMGEATVDLATADPDRDYLAVDVHTPGVANLLAVAAERGLTNVRVAEGDALDLFRHQLAPDSVDAVHVFFPDPWPKARHHKRRLIQPAHVALLRSRLRVGGTLHCATDDAAYAAAMLAAVTGFDGGVVERPAWRPVTKFEARAVLAGRSVTDLAFRRPA